MRIGFAAVATENWPYAAAWGGTRDAHNQGIGQVGLQPLHLFIMPSEKVPPSRAERIPIMCAPFAWHHRDKLQNITPTLELPAVHTQVPIEVTSLQQLCR